MPIILLLLINYYYYYFDHETWDLLRPLTLDWTTNGIDQEVEGNLVSFDVQNWEDNVYVAVGKSDSSMDALAWTLKHAVTPSTIVYLVHVFLETWYIPSPCKLSLDLSPFGW